MAKAKLAVPIPELGGKARLQFSMKTIEHLCVEASASGNPRWFADAIEACQQMRAGRIRYYAGATLRGATASELFAALPLGEIATRLLDALCRAQYGRTLAEWEASNA